MIESKKEIAFPSKIKELISRKEYTIDDIGKSTSTVILFDDMVLKIEEHDAKIDRTVQMMQWLEGKLPVPTVICYEIFENKSYLLMSRMNGEMSCEKYYLERPQELTKLLADGLKILWEIDISDCPYQRELDAELAEAKERVERNLVDISDTQPETFGPNGFESPSHLLKWLEENKPELEPVFSHGDYCLQNVMLKDGKVSGFIDIGTAGVADKWRDIALCYRSLKNNFDGTYGGRIYEDFNPEILFEKLGIEPNWEKIKYYMLLDELF